MFVYTGSYKYHKRNYNKVNECYYCINNIDVYFLDDSRKIFSLNHSKSRNVYVPFIVIKCKSHYTRFSIYWYLNIKIFILIICGLRNVGRKIKHDELNSLLLYFWYFMSTKMSCQKFPMFTYPCFMISWLLKDIQQYDIISWFYY